MSDNHVRNHALILEYRGDEFQGYQFQADQPTVQGALERALSTLLRAEIKTHCSGRTDTGVHATGQVVSFQTEHAVKGHSARADGGIDEWRFLHSLNAVLPDGIAARRLIDVPLDFHARFSSLAREYEYLIWNAPTRTPHWHGRALWRRDRLPVEELNEQLSTLPGHRDFAAMTRLEYKDETTIRYVDFAQIKRVLDPITGSDDLVSFRIRGNAFLHNMIRIIVGTLLDISQAKVRGDLNEILETGDRLRAGQTAAAVGLYFRHSYYAPMEGVEGLATLTDYPVFRRKPPINH